MSIGGPRANLDTVREKSLLLSQIEPWSGSLQSLSLLTELSQLIQSSSTKLEINGDRILHKLLNPGSHLQEPPN